MLTPSFYPSASSQVDICFLFNANCFYGCCHDELLLLQYECRDAESRGCLERDAHARQLFPQVWRWVDERRVKINQEKSVSDPSIAYRVPGNRTNSAILRQVESKGKKQDMQTQQGKKNKGQGRRESKGGTIQRINRKAGATKNRHRESDFIPSWQKERR